MIGDINARQKVMASGPANRMIRIGNTAMRETRVAVWIPFA